MLAIGAEAGDGIMMGPFEYYQASSVSEACELLSDDGAMVLAGGTDLLIAMKRGIVNPRRLIHIASIPELHGVQDHSDCIWLGAGVAFVELARNPLVRRHAFPLAQAAAVMGSPQIRSLATVGGNIVNGSPGADSPVALLAMDASVEVASRQGIRELSLMDLLSAPPGQVALARGELLTRIRLSKLPTGYRGAFVKLGRRNALAIARLSVAAVGLIDEQGVVRLARIAVGAVAPHPFRVLEAEAMLKGNCVTRDLLGEVVHSVAQAAARTLGERASAPYKREAIKGVTWEALERCFGLVSDEVTR